MGQEPCLCAKDGDLASSPACSIWSPVGGSGLSEQVCIEKKETIDKSQIKMHLRMAADLIWDSGTGTFKKNLGRQRNLPRNRCLRALVPEDRD